MGKGMVDETHEMYVGVWSGEISAPGVAAVGKASDLVVTLGCFPTYLNTGGFTRELDETRTIHINPFDVVVSSSLASFSCSSWPFTDRHRLIVRDLGQRIYVQKYFDQSPPKCTRRIPPFCTCT